MQEQLTEGRDYPVSELEHREFSFDPDDDSFYLGPTRQGREDPETAEELGLLEEDDNSYRAVLLHDPQAMYEAAQPTVSCIADDLSEFERIAEDQDTFFTSLERNGETHGYARGTVLPAGEDEIYWFDTIKLPSILDHSRYEEFSDLHRTAVLTHSVIGDQLDVETVAGSAHYIVEPDLQYSQDSSIRVDQLYPGIEKMDPEIEETSKDVKIESSPTDYPNLIYRMP